MIRTVVILEYALLAMVGVIIATQIITPAIRNTPFFPLLHRKGLELENQAAEANQADEFSKLQKALAERRLEAAKDLSLDLSVPTKK